VSSLKSFRLADLSTFRTELMGLCAVGILIGHMNLVLNVGGGNKDTIIIWC